VTTGLGISLTDEIVERVNSALSNRKPIVVSYVGTDDRPRMSLRGSTHVHRPDQLAIWVRKAEGGIVEAIAGNPAVSLLYRDSDSRTTYVFSGRAHVASDEATRREVFDASPEPERDHDPDRLGVAVLIDLDEVKGGTVGGTQVAMSREG
jgi:general stress protein 26